MKGLHWFEKALIIGTCIGFPMAGLIAAQTACPPHFDIGQNYHEIQSGPCPDIDSVATFRAPDSVHVGYYCPSKNVMVIGDMRNGKMDGFFLLAK